MQYISWNKESASKNYYIENEHNTKAFSESGGSLVLEIMARDAISSILVKFAYDGEETWIVSKLARLLDLVINGLAVISYAENDTTENMDIVAGAYSIRFTRDIEHGVWFCTEFTVQHGMDYSKPDVIFSGKANKFTYISRDFARLSMGEFDNVRR